MKTAGPRMRVLVTGSRDWDNEQAIWIALTGIAFDHHPADVVVVHGACPTGADAIADRDASLLGFQIERYPADWARFGKPAGPRRNREMVELGADLCLSFNKGNSRGTAHCTALAVEAGIPVRRYVA